MLGSICSYKIYVILIVLFSNTWLCILSGNIDNSVLHVMSFKEFFTEYGEANLYEIQEVAGKGSYGVVAAAVSHTGEKVAIKKIDSVFEHVSEATRILREIKLLRLLRHPDIVEIKHIMLPSCRREFKDIYVVFELMETDLHHVLKTNDDLTPGHHQFFLYQLLRALKYIHSGWNIFYSFYNFLIVLSFTH